MIRASAAFVELTGWTEANAGAFTVDQIAKAVEMVTGISLHRLKFSNRDQEYVDARHLFTWYSRKLKAATYMRIGKMQARHYSTSIDQFKVASGFLETGDATFTDKAQRIREALQLLK